MLNGELTEMIRAGEMLRTRGHSSQAFPWVASRESEFSAEPIYLAFTSSLAEVAEDFSTAFDFALRNLQALATDPAVDLYDAIERAASLAPLAGIDNWPNASVEIEGSLTIGERCLASEIASRRGDHPDAKKWLEIDLEKIDSVAAYRVTRQAIRNAQRRGDHNAAVELMLSLLRSGEQLRISYLSEVVPALLRAERRSEALDWAQRWRREAPESLAAWHMEIRILVGLKRNDEAITILRTARRRFPDDRELLVRFASLCLQQKQYADAEEAYWKLYQLERGDPAPWVKALHQLASRDRDRSGSNRIRDAFEQRMRQNRKSIRPLLALMEIARLENDFERETGLLRKMLILEPDDPRLRQRLATAQADAGDWQLAIQTLRDIPESNTDAALEVSKAIIAIQLRFAQYTSAAEAMSAACDHTATKDTDIDRWIDQLLYFGAFGAAATVENARIAKQGENVERLYRLGIWLEENQDHPAASEAFLRVLKIAHEQTAGDLAGPADSTENPWHLEYRPAYGYRQNRHRGRLYSLGSVNRTTGPEIPDLDQSASTSRRAFWHLARLAALEKTTATPDAKMDWEKRLADSGVSDSSLKQFFAIVDANDTVYPQVTLPTTNQSPDANGSPLTLTLTLDDTSTMHATGNLARPRIIPLRPGQAPAHHLKIALEARRHEQAARISAPLLIEQVYSWLNRPRQAATPLRINVSLGRQAGADDQSDYHETVLKETAALMQSWPPHQRKAFQSLIDSSSSKPDDAITELRELLDDEPDNDTLRLLLIANQLNQRAIPTTSPSTSALLAEVKALAPHSAAGRLANTWLFSDDSWQTLQRSVQLIIELSQEKNRQARKTLDPPVASLWQTLTGIHRRSDAEVRSATLEALFDPEKSKAPDDESAAQALDRWRTERAELHRQLCLAMLNTEPHAKLGLTALGRQYEAEGTPPPVDLWDRAIEIYSKPVAAVTIIPTAPPDSAAIPAVTIIPTAPPGSAAIPFLSGNPHMPNANPNANARRDRRTPRSGANFLVWLAQQTGHETELQTELLPQLQATGNDELASDIKELVTWYFSGTEQFTESLNRQIDGIFEDVENFATVRTQLTRIESAISIGIEREHLEVIGTGLSTLTKNWASAELRSSTKTRPRFAEIGRLIGPLERVLDDAADQLNEPQLASVFAAITGPLAGLRKDRHDFLEQVHHAGAHSPEYREVELLFWLMNWADQWGEEKPLLSIEAWGLRRTLGEWPEETVLRPAEPKFAQIGSQKMLHTGPAVTALVNRPEFLGSAKSFDVMPMNFGEKISSESMFEHLIERMRGSVKNQTWYLNWLDENGGDEFGAGLIQVLLTPPRVPADASTIAPFVDDFQRLTLEQQSLLASYIENRIDSPLGSPSLLTWLSDFGTARWQQRFDQLKRAGRPKEVSRLTGNDLAKLIFEAAAFGRIDDAMEVLEWCRQWPGTTRKGTPCDLRYYTQQALNDLGGRNTSKPYETNIVLAAAILTDHPDLPPANAVDAILRGRSAFFLKSHPKHYDREQPVNEEMTQRFQRSIDAIAALAHGRGIDDMVVALLARSPRVPTQWAIIRQRALGENRGSIDGEKVRWLWKRLLPLVSIDGKSTNLRTEGLHEFLRDEMPLAQRLTLMETIGQSIDFYGNPRPAPGKMTAENAEVIAGTLIEILNKSDKSWLPRNDTIGQIWVRAAMQEFFSIPTWNAATPAGKTELENARTTLITFAENYKFNPKDPAYRTSSNIPKPVPTSWDIAFATLLCSRRYEAAEAMWNQVRDPDKVLEGHLYWPSSDYLMLCSPLTSRSGESISVPTRLVSFEQFWTAQNSGGELPEIVRKLKLQIEAQESSAMAFSMPYQRASYHFGTTFKHLPTEIRLPFLLACLDEQWINHCFWPPAVTAKILPEPTDSPVDQQVEIDAILGDVTARINRATKSEERTIVFLLSHYLYYWCRGSSTPENRLKRSSIVSRWLETSTFTESYEDAFRWTDSPVRERSTFYWQSVASKNELPFGLRRDILHVLPKYKPLPREILIVGAQLDAERIDAVPFMLRSSTGAPYFVEYLERHAQDSVNYPADLLVEFSRLWMAFRERHPTLKVNPAWHPPVIAALRATGNTDAVNKELDLTKKTRP